MKMEKPIARSGKQASSPVTGFIRSVFDLGHRQMPLLGFAFHPLVEEGHAATSAQERKRDDGRTKCRTQGFTEASESRHGDMVHEGGPTQQPPHKANNLISHSQPMAAQSTRVPALIANSFHSESVQPSPLTSESVQPIPLTRRSLARQPRQPQSSRSIGRSPS